MHILCASNKAGMKALMRRNNMTCTSIWKKYLHRDKKKWAGITVRSGASVFGCSDCTVGVAEEIYSQEKKNAEFCMIKKDDSLDMHHVVL
jgi:hypothetical protein